MTAKVNYTPEMVKTITAQYAELGNEGLETIAEAIGRSVRSVRAKLVREQVYVADTKPEAKPRDEGPTKKELLIELDATGAFDTAGLEGATKPAIAAILAFVQNDEVES